MMKTKARTDSRLALKGLAISALAGLMLTACGGGAPAGGGEMTSYEVAGDHAIGSTDAPVTIVEYASVTCGACANWHAAVWPDLKKDYIDTGKVRFVFREFPTPPQNLAMAGFMIANCADEDQFFANISLQFDRQQQLINSARTGRAAAEYQALAKAAGLNESAYETCLANEVEQERLKAVIEGGYERGVNSTPSFFINGVQKSVFKLEDFEKEFAALGVDVPVHETADDKASSE